MFDALNCLCSSTLTAVSYNKHSKQPTLELAHIMKIRVVLSIVFLLLLGMTGVNLYVGVQLKQAQENLRISQGQLSHLTALSEDLVNSSQWETRFARAYIETKDPQKREWYDKVDGILEGSIPRPENYNLVYWDLVAGGFISAPENKDEKSLSLEDRFLRQLVTAEEINQLKNAHILYKRSCVIERIAMNAMDGRFDDGTGSFLKKGKPDPLTAHKLLFSEDYSKLNGEISLTVAKLIADIERRYAAKIKVEEDSAEKLLSISSYLNSALFGLIIISMFFLRVKWLNRSRKVLRAISEISEGNLSIRAPVFGNDEVSMTSKAVNRMADNLCFALEKLEEKVSLSEKALSDLEVERRRSEKLLHNILPAAIAERLQGGEETIAEIHPEVTVFFSDIVGFTELSAKLGPTETVHLLNEIFGKFDELVEKHGVEKIKTIGDSYMVVGGVPNRDPLHCQHVAEFAIESLKFLEEYSRGLRFPLHMRIGIHTGTVAAGIVGKKRFSYDLWGDVVNVASRYESTSMPDKIHVSEAVKVRLDDDYLLIDGGAVDLKGKGSAKSYFLMGKKSEMPQVIEFRSPSSAS